MTEQQTVTVDPELARQALDDVLNTDAAAAAGPAEPPKTPWLNPDGSARYGTKADGTPRRSPAGPGRGKTKDDKPRADTEQDKPADGKPAPSAPVPVADYTADLEETGLAVWMVLSCVPFLQAHAAVWNAQVPPMARAWSHAAQRNAAVRKYVERLTGEGGWTWVIPVTVATMPLALNSLAILRDPKLRAELAASNQVNFAEYLKAMMDQLEEEFRAETSSPASSSRSAPAAA